MKSGKGVSRAQELGILALLRHSCRQTAAAEAGVSVTTLWRWCRQPAFADRLRKQQREVLNASMGQLQAATAAAVKALHEIAEDRKAHSMSRVMASRIILDLAQRSIELQDLEQRLSAIEATTNNGKGPRLVG